MGRSRHIPEWKATPIAIYDEDDELVVRAQRLAGLEAAAHATANLTSPRDVVPDLELMAITNGKDWLDKRQQQKLSLTVASNQQGNTRWFHLQVGFIYDPHMTGERYRVVVEAVRECEPPYWAG